MNVVLQSVYNISSTREIALCNLKSVLLKFVETFNFLLISDSGNGLLTNTYVYVRFCVYLDSNYIPYLISNLCQTIVLIMKQILCPIRALHFYKVMMVFTN